MARKKSVALAGGSGLVGGEALRMLLADASVAHVVAILRRPLEGSIAGDPKLEQHVVDFDKLAKRPPPRDVDAVVCALGTTIKVAGSQEAFRRVDYDYPLALARLGLAAGAKQFVLLLKAEEGNAFEVALRHGLKEEDGGPYAAAACVGPLSLPTNSRQPAIRANNSPSSRSAQ